MPGPRSVGGSRGSYGVFELGSGSVKGRNFSYGRASHSCLVLHAGHPVRSAHGSHAGGGV
ncbi:hypothetical protein SBA2_70041 [Acidobacteriia bacterium SbA2]|nr:hypothetical protein SBA2_70041 [Acidobacteriia bacterium SbA2]